MEKPLSKTERKELDELVGVVDTARLANIEAASALLRIRDRRLYRETHDTFEEFCLDRWGYSRARAYQLMDFSKIRGQLEDKGVVVLPQNEKQARWLKRLKAPDEQVAAWEDAVETSTRVDKQPTATAVKIAVEARIPRPASAPEPERSSEPRRAECFNCGQMYTPPDSYWGTHVDAQKLPIAEQRRILRGIEDHISKVTGLKIPDPKTEKQKKAAAVFWYQIEREFAELSNWNLRDAEVLIAKSAKARLDAGIMIESPKTIIGAARAIAGGQTTTSQSGRKKSGYELYKEMYQND